MPAVRLDLPHIADVDTRKQNRHGEMRRAGPRAEGRPSSADGEQQVIAV
jgi:hypothetical protein